VTQQPTVSAQGDLGQPHSSLATGVIVFAAVMMMLSGGFQVFAGLVALFQDDFYVTTPNYLWQFDTTVWGWTHTLLGLLLLLASFAVLSGKTWGRTIGIILAALSALASFAFIPYYPVWSLVVIALDVLVVWALAVHGRQMAG
jgi:hypothetical protein